MSSEDNKALEETSTHLVDTVLTDVTDKTDDVEDEFVKSLISAQQRQKTPSPPPATTQEPEVALIDTDPFSEVDKPAKEETKEPSWLDEFEQKTVEPEQESAPTVPDTQDFTSTPVDEADQLSPVISKLDELEVKNEAAEPEVHAEFHAHRDDPFAEESVPAAVNLDPFENEPIEIAEHNKEHIIEQEPEPVHSEPVEIHEHNKEHIIEQEPAREEEPIEIHEHDKEHVIEQEPEPVHSEPIEIHEHNKEHIIEQEPEPAPIEVPVHNKEHIIEQEPAPIASSAFEEPPKPIDIPQETQPEVIKEPSPVFAPEPIQSPPPVQVTEEKKETIEQKSVPEPPKSEPEPATINAPSTSNDDASSTSRKAKQPEGLFKRVKSHCAII
ncbi:hypothetical protein M3Y97_00075300 [Aphelenchoides bicaudatus]|nr:hypothetical protein M3Y97_00075300 [Aphelenchoides bicaudatus]